MQLPKPLLQLIDELSSLPGVGRRSATRMAFYLLQADPQKTKSVGESLGTIHSKIKKCNLCNNFSVSSICQICADDGRSQDQLLVVESALDLVAFTETDYAGLFYVLG
ncbi:MAG: recombination protein RecR, partial [Candidatus Dojkabacteria bacterium]